MKSIKSISEEIISEKKVTRVDAIKLALAYPEVESASKDNSGGIEVKLMNGLVINLSPNRNKGYSMEHLERTIRVEKGLNRL